MRKNKIVTIYARANDEYALARQINELKSVCKKKDYKIYEIYTDIGVSGRTLENRYGFQKMMEDLKDKKFESIMVCDPSRIARNLAICMDFLKEIKKYDCNLELPTGIFEEAYSNIANEEIIKNIIAFYGRVGTKKQL